MRLLKLLLVLFVCAAGPAVAGPYEDGVAAYERGAYATAQRLWHPLATQGDPDAQYQLGMMSFRGDGVPKDYATAGAWFRKAAEQGFPDAQAILGSMYADGEMGPQDYVRAYMWLNLAMEGYKKRRGPQDQFNFGRTSGWLNFIDKMTPAQIAEAQKLAREWKPK